MALNFYSVKCPTCGANLSIEEDRKKCFCSYCGAQIIINNENEHIYHTIDEARIKEAETDRMIRLKELELETAKMKRGNTLRTVLTCMWIASIFIVGGICVAVWLSDSSGLGGLAAFNCLFYVGGPVVGGGAYLIFKVLPDRELAKQGGIRIPDSIFPLDCLNYNDTVKILQSAGFTNISCVNAHDSVVGLSMPRNTVESITIDGKRLMSRGKVYPINANIVIKYHGV